MAHATKMPGTCGRSGPEYGPRAMIQRIFALIVSLFVVTCASAAEKFPSITHAELKQAIAENKVVLLDANGSETFRSGHIPGAVDFSAHAGDIAAVLPADKEALIVAYCGNEQCGAYARAADAARKLGYKNVKHYAPGIAGWKSSGEPVQKSS